MPEKIYRARGKHNFTNRNAWVTTVWRRSKEEAQSDINAFAVGNFSNVKIVEQSYKEFLKKNQKIPRF